MCICIYVYIWICKYKQTYSYTLGILRDSIKHIKIEAIVIYIKYKSGNRHRKLLKNGLLVWFRWQRRIVLVWRFIYMYISYWYGWLFLLNMELIHQNYDLSMYKTQHKEWSCDMQYCYLFNYILNVMYTFAHNVSQVLIVYNSAVI